MALQILLATRNAMADLITSNVGATGQLRIYTGSPPSLPSDAPTGTLLSQHALANPFSGAAAAGALSPTLPANVNAGNTGTAGYWRVYNNAGATCYLQGTCGTSAADMILNTVSLVSGGPVAITGFTLTQGGA